MTTFTIPIRAEFIRTQLVEHLDALGHHVYDVEERDGFPCLTIEASDGSSYEDIAVTTDGRFMSMVDGWRQVTLRGFEWQAEEMDTGAMHGPCAASTACLLPGAEHAACADRTCYAKPTCARCGDPLPAGVEMHPTCRTLS